MMNINSIKTKDRFHNFIRIKQLDNTSPIEVLLCDSTGALLSGLNEKCTVSIYDAISREVRQVSDEQIVDGVLSFKIVNDLLPCTHKLEVTTFSGVKFPADDDFQIFVSESHNSKLINVIKSIPTELALKVVTQQVMNRFNSISDNFVNYIKKGEVTVNDLDVREKKITKEYISDDLINSIQSSEALSKENQSKFTSYVKKGEVTVGDIDKNKGLLDASFFSSTFLSQLKGGTINATNLLDGSVTNLKLADKAITNVKLADNHDYVKTLENDTDTYSVVRTGNYMLNANGGYLNLPPDADSKRVYQLKVESISNVWLMQTLVDFSEPKNQWKRRIHKTSTSVREQWNTNFNLRNGSIGGVQLMDAYSLRNNLNSGTDINTIFKEGTYVGISTSNYTNIPKELIGKNFVLQVIPARADGAFKQQIITPFDDLTTTYKRFTITRDGNADWQMYRISSEDVSKPLAGKIIVIPGDSIVENGDWPEKFAAITGATVIKAGFGGCRMAQHTQSGNGLLYDKQCMYRLVDYIKSGDFTELIQATEDMVRANGDDNRTQALALSKADWSEIDYMTIAFGTNDFGGDIPIGTDADMDGTTFKGALNKVIKTMSESKPHIKLMFITPFYRDRFQATGDGKNSDDFPNNTGAYLKEYVQAIETIAKKHHIPVINMYDNSGINRYNQSYYLADGLHPNATGYAYLADTLARQMIARL
ncbi:hypothetical protein CW689_01495 [Macrococcoides caseolyticum]|nr:hypothetical protein CW689_01495 [Macrococcus caseolyticus]